MQRLKRLRKNKAIRGLAAQVNLAASNLVMPYFISEGQNIKQPIASMPGVFRFSRDNLLKEAEGLIRIGIKSVILFGVPGNKDDKGQSAYQEGGIIQEAVSALKKHFSDELVVITDVCLCGYTKHGHCGVIKTQDASVDNDATIKILARIALSHAQAGADMVAPSAMMDGQVAAIREALDKNGFKDTAIMGYSAKFASNFYGPFRDAAESSMKFGDRKSYQMDFRNTDEALREIAADIREGADMVMVKPALAYLDIIAKAKERFNLPIAAYSVSGEYSMVKAYAQGAGAEKELALEILTAIKRAGADIIISYWAREAARWLK
ncbi:porphobilinogen synthase [bacterium]|nr:MAG: porphobilinogen synthase [bacterium]